MPATQTWNMLLIPDAFHEIISKEYSLALMAAEEYRTNNVSTIAKWSQHPESFGWYMLACDVADRHMYYNPWMESETLRGFYGLFNLETFYTFFYKFFYLCAPRQKTGEFEVAEVVVTHGDTAPAVLFQAIGRDAIDELPGFFGNFYIERDCVSRELEKYRKLIAKRDRNELIQSGVNFYNAPCDSAESLPLVEEILNALPNALEYAIQQRCGLLGLVVTAG